MKPSLALLEASLCLLALQIVAASAGTNDLKNEQSDSKPLLDKEALTSLSKLFADTREDWSLESRCHFFRKKLAELLPNHREPLRVSIEFLAARQMPFGNKQPVLELLNQCREGYITGTIKARELTPSADGNSIKKASSAPENQQNPDRRVPTSAEREGQDSNTNFHGSDSLEELGRAENELAKRRRGNENETDSGSNSDAESKIELQVSSDSESDSDDNSFHNHRAPLVGPRADEAARWAAEQMADGEVRGPNENAPYFLPSGHWFASSDAGFYDSSGRRRGRASKSKKTWSTSGHHGASSRKRHGFASSSQAEVYSQEWAKKMRPSEESSSYSDEFIESEKQVHPIEALASRLEHETRRISGLGQQLGEMERQLSQSAEILMGFKSQLEAIHSKEEADVSRMAALREKYAKILEQELHLVEQHTAKSLEEAQKRINELESLHASGKLAKQEVVVEEDSKKTEDRPLSFEEFARKLMDKIPVDEPLENRCQKYFIVYHWYHYKGERTSAFVKFISRIELPRITVDAFTPQDELFVDLEKFYQSLAQLHDVQNKSIKRLMSDIGNCLQLAKSLEHHDAPSAKFEDSPASKYAFEPAPGTVYQNPAPKPAEQPQPQVSFQFQAQTQPKPQPQPQPQSKPHSQPQPQAQPQVRPGVDAYIEPPSKPGRRRIQIDETPTNKASDVYSIPVDITNRRGGRLPGEMPTYRYSSPGPMLEHFPGMSSNGARARSSFYSHGRQSWNGHGSNPNHFIFETSEDFGDDFPFYPGVAEMRHTFPH